MTDVETLEERVRTVERAVTDGDHEFPEATNLADLHARIERVEERLTELDDRTSELEAATQALRGYVGNVRSVNQDVERRADAALSAVEGLEQRFEGRQPSASGTAIPDRSPAAASAETPARTETAGLADTTAPTDATAPAETATRDAHNTRDASATATDATRRRSPSTDAADLADSTRADDNHADSREDPGVIERIRSVL
ncbi:DUF7310 family coiled-coil domain-containing protein [Haloarcula amylovorans]|uniref:DUF7310 family coiled-coil domain-containing protein n=1 Tax=Haloarcula amylovorans TaxID=2562280 RepID=UPI001076B09E|nr:hypothetical protein [Halomicroarcula amylolytica]